MISVTESAQNHIREIARASGAENLALRIAARVDDEGNLEYGMGFDEPGAEDTTISCGEITVVVAPNCVEILEEAVLDYVEIDEGKMDFIFFNPNDPNHKRPKSGA